jgi:hypothetical protein
VGSRQQSLVPRFSGLIQRMHGWRGTGNPAPDIAPEISHHVILENDRPEAHYLAGSRRVSWSINVPAGGAGNFSQALLFNPAASGVLMVIEVILGEKLTAALASVGMIGSTTGFTVNTDGVGFRDTRLGLQVAATPVGQMFFKNNAAVVSGFKLYDYFMRAAVTEQLALDEIDFTLKPGTGVVVANATANEALVVSYHGRERALEVSEN